LLHSATFESPSSGVPGLVAGVHVFLAAFGKEDGDGQIVHEQRRLLNQSGTYSNLAVDRGPIVLA